MKPTLLENAIEVLISEVLRGFNLNKFKTIPSIIGRIKYANSILPKLGKGSSRIVYALSSDKVLKIALNDKGFAQNNAELELYTSPETKPVVAKIYDASPDNSWLISEIVQPFSNSRADWQAATGFDYLIFANLVKEWELLEEPPVQEWLSNLVKSWQQRLVRMAGQEQTPIYKITQTRLKNYIRMNKSPLVHGIFGLLKQGLNRADVANIKADNTSNNVIGHFGKTIDGRIVLLDYGYTVDVWEKHYKQEQEAENTTASSEVPAGPSVDVPVTEHPPETSAKQSDRPIGSVPPRRVGRNQAAEAREEEDEEPFLVPTGQSLK